VVEPLGDLVVGKDRSEVRARHGVLFTVGVARLALQLVPGEHGGPEGAPGIAGGGLDPNVVEQTGSQNLTVGHAVKGDAAGQAQVLLPGHLAGVSGHFQDHLFGDHLNRTGKVHFALGQVGFRLARGTAEQVGEAVVGHGQTVEIPEVVHVQLETAVFTDFDEVFANLVGVKGLAVGCQTHQLVFTRVDPKSGEIGHGRIEQTQAVGKVGFLQHGDLVALAVAEAAGGPFADAVQGQHGRIFKGARKKGAGGVGFVVLSEQDLAGRTRARLVQAAFYFRWGWPSGTRTARVERPQNRS